MPDTTKNRSLPRGETNRTVKPCGKEVLPDVPAKSTNMNGIMVSLVCVVIVSCQLKKAFPDSFKVNNYSLSTPHRDWVKEIVYCALRGFLRRFWLTMTGLIVSMSGSFFGFVVATSGWSRPRHRIESVREHQNGVPFQRHQTVTDMFSVSGWRRWRWHPNSNRSSATKLRVQSNAVFDRCLSAPIIPIIIAAAATTTTTTTTMDETILVLFSVGRKKENREGHYKEGTHLNTKGKPNSSISSKSINPIVSC